MTPADAGQARVSRAKDLWIAGAAFALGWLTSKTWQDPGCQMGLVVFLVAAAVLVLGFAVAVTGHGRAGAAPPEDPDEKDQP